MLRDEMRRESVADGAIGLVPASHFGCAPSTIAGVEPAGEATPNAPSGQRNAASPSIPAAKRARRAKIGMATNRAVPDATIAADEAAERAIDCVPQGHREAAREGGEGQSTAVTHGGTADPALIHIIRSLHREHRGIQRAVGDWTRRIKAEERWFAVARMRAAGEPLPDGRFPKTTPADEAVVVATRARYFAARDVTETHRKACQRELLKAAKQLPAAAWVQGVRGFGMPSFAAIVGEAGDLGSYDSVAKLWKRMGLAVIDGKSQRRVSDAAEAARHGYNPRRRSEMHVVGECILKAGGPYREVYDQRKAYETERAPEMSKIHAHRRAMRYVEKRLLRDLWRAWRQAIVAAIPSISPPAAEHREAA